MPTNTVSASVPIKVARQNYYATLAIDVQGSLAQTWDDSSNTASPNWGTDATKRPVLTPVVNCPASLSPSTISIEWFRDGVKIGDALNGASDTSAYDITNTGVLTIKANLASASNTDPDTFTCKMTIRVNNVNYNLERSVSATILPASADGYAVVIEADRTALSGTSGDQTYSCTLHAVVYYKGTPITSNVTYQWYKGGTAIASETNATLTVTRANVDWEQLYRVEVKVGGVLQGIGSIVVTDQADNYAISATVSGDVTESAPAKVEIQLMQRKTGDGTWTTFGMAANYSASIYDVADNDSVVIVNNSTLNNSGYATFNVSSSVMASVGNGIEAGYIDIVANW